MIAPSRAAQPIFSEYVLTPMSWWVVGELIALSVAMALVLCLPPVQVIILLGTTALVVARALITCGHTVRLSADGLHIDRNRLALGDAVTVAALDAAVEARRG